MDRRKLGIYGESLVHKELKDSIWSNTGRESGKNYDIEWNGLFIDVKTTSQSSPSTKHAFQFYDCSIPKPKELFLFVFVAIIDKKIMCWVSKPKDKRVYYMKEKDSFSLKSLDQKIKNLSKNEI